MNGICDRQGCTEAARYRPVLQLRAGFGGPATAELGLELCPKHAIDTELGDLVDDAGWEKIAETFRDLRKVIPRRELTTVLYRPIKKKGR